MTTGLFFTEVPFSIVDGDAAVGFARISTPRNAYKALKHRLKMLKTIAKSWRFSLITRRFQSKSLVHARQLGKHYKGYDHEGLQPVICMTFRLFVFVSEKF